MESNNGKVSARSGIPDPRQLVLVDAKLYFDKSTHSFWLQLLQTTCLVHLQTAVLLLIGSGKFYTS